MPSLFYTAGSKWETTFKQIFHLMWGVYSGFICSPTITYTANQEMCAFSNLTSGQWFADQAMQYSSNVYQSGEMSYVENFAGYTVNKVSPEYGYWRQMNGYDQYSDTEIEAFNYYYYQ